MVPPRPSPVEPWGLWERSLGMVAGVCLTGLRGAHRPPHTNWVVPRCRTLALTNYECRVGADLALKAAGTLSAPALELGNIIPEWVSNSGVLYNNSYDLPTEPRSMYFFSLPRVSDRARPRAGWGLWPLWAWGGWRSLSLII